MRLLRRRPAVAVPHVAPPMRVTALRHAPGDPADGVVMATAETRIPIPLPSFDAAGRCQVGPLHLVIRPDPSPSAVEWWEVVVHGLHTPPPGRWGT